MRPISVFLETVEQNDFIDAVEEFRPERRTHHRHHLVLDRIGVLAIRLIDQEFGAKI